MSGVDLAAIQKQVEYYFSDKNLKKDRFFHSKISADKEGWVDISFIMNCNKVKQLTTNQEDVVEAIKDSTEVEFDTGGVRRRGNKALPELVEEKKEEEKVEQQDDGVITERDFKNPKIVSFKVTSKSEENKDEPSWRDLENHLEESFPTLKFLYSRQKEFVGQLAISSNRTDTAALSKLMKDTITIADFDYLFEEPNDEDLKEFWENHGSHYEMCQKQKLRKMRKRKREEKAANGDKDGSKKQKVEDDKQYTIAGTTYMNINKVKSKAKTIMNIKDDGQKLEGYEEEFLKEIIKHHEKHDEKMKDFSHFIVDEHPSYRNTRCFFVVRADGTKEDFSMSKCIKKMEETE
ncbi:unnamed protein product [Moneuplotes crassus]|uniref:HTH La-type RNA-binding domain-containing protein n=2 Tax=Euplotes crassus TaxID=5936 RepID=A0AAD2CW53_EUPCR|nr:unnamed protein product [Moneuplotes crassus]|eukprot:CAMPEP_0197004392 /NCGR_PEP_ID=MMETSP1380-20130617/22117_1 /TAXON_ID=5936 /ORGANISM="Euplotes crassus, Strain CT5" /LENGTH=347 /DNA_ID=CAMNT_0042423161 /DNA_START=27 /DNA_END=1070 /DNA_ORIENTATION=+